MACCGTDLGRRFAKPKQGRWPRRSTGAEAELGCQVLAGNLAAARQLFDLVQDGAYFFSALATSSTSRTRGTLAKAPVRLPKDAYLTLKRTGAADSAAGIVDVLVDVVLQGPA